MFNKDFIYLNEKFDSKKSIFSFVEQNLINEGFVQNGFGKQLMEREELYPTGLPTAPAVALPHTDGSLVLKNLIVVVTLENSIKFGEMGGLEDSEVESEIIFILVIQEGEKHLEHLQKAIQFIQDSEKLLRLKSSTDVNEVYKLLKENIN